MNQTQTFEQFIANQVPQVSPLDFAINLVLTAFLTFLLGRVYASFGNSISNKKSFAENFELIGITTMIIITIVKSSLALSLGLVGALSIVRFRAAIKEPEELSYIFFTIAIGLGMGADQRLITLIGFAFIGLMIWLKNYFKTTRIQHNLNFTVLTRKPSNVTLESIINSISDHSKGVELKRLDESNEHMEAAFLAEFRNYDQLQMVRKSLNELDDSLQINFLDHKGIF
jgi:uncharacterized membrane protein YhiD involved in acid resistance